MGRRRRGRNPDRRAPIDRFSWEDGDVVVLYDPSKDPNALTDTEKRAERHARGETPEEYHRRRDEEMRARGETPQEHSRRQREEMRSRGETAEEYGRRMRAAQFDSRREE